MSADHTRRGRFRADRVLYEGMMPIARRALEKKILVHRADLDADGQTYTLLATSPDFDLIAPGAAAPFYRLTFTHREANGDVGLTIERDDALTAIMETSPPAIAESFEVKATISTAEKRKAIERELGFRRRVYPKSVADGKMKQAEADHQIAVMEAILKDYA